uniref:uncharacterized protein LOC122588066 n=1 Tax=Erigeron canadensis TaxID=72917 RepID=UPI001CB8B631|nr:uncharacterized protein LOC122588066 [Erigeron canadensis]
MSQNLDLTIVAAKGLKNVTWKNGELQPFAVFGFNTSNYGRKTTTTDTINNTKPIWNQRFCLPIPNQPSHETIFWLDIKHEDVLVAGLRVPIFGVGLLNPQVPGVAITRSFDVFRPSGRPSGKIKLKLALIDAEIGMEAASLIEESILPPPPDYGWKIYSDSASKGDGGGPRTTPTGCQVCYDDDASENVPNEDLDEYICYRPRGGY